MDKTQSQDSSVVDDPAAQELIEKLGYVRNWLDLAPDFHVMAQSFMVKMMLDRKGALLEPDEAQRVEEWLENFYKDMSTVMGVLESHIEVTFPANAMLPKRSNPDVKLTPEGEEWVRAKMAEAQEMRQQQPEA